eukprot:gene9891-13305_t
MNLFGIYEYTNHPVVKLGQFIGTKVLDYAKSVFFIKINPLQKLFDGDKRAIETEVAEISSYFVSKSKFSETKVNSHSHPNSEFEQHETNYVSNVNHNMDNSNIKNNNSKNTIAKPTIHHTDSPIIPPTSTKKSEENNKLPQSLIDLNIVLEMNPKVPNSYDDRLSLAKERIQLDYKLFSNPNNNINSKNKLIYYDLPDDINIKHVIQEKASSRNLVLGIAVKTDALNFEIFCRSFRLVSDGDAIIFVNRPIQQKIIDIAADAHIKLIDFDVGSLKPDFMINYHPSSIRWILYDRNLLQSYDRVIAVDVRDTLFQTDPFLLLPKDQNGLFHAFGEVRESMIGACGWNSGWVKDCFGQEVLNAVYNSPIICSGISMGTMDMMSKYIHTMASLLLGLNPYIGTGFPKCERNGVDQGVHNVIINLNLLQINKNMIFYPEDFPVINMQSAQSYLPSTDRPNLLLNNEGNKFSIVHQYDRNNDFQIQLAKKFIPSFAKYTSVSDEFTGENVCNNNYKMEMNAELFRGKCDLSSIRVMSISSCCNVCYNNDKKKCTSFTFTNGQCFLKSCNNNEINNILKHLKGNRHPFQQQDAYSGFLSSFVTTK